MKRLIAPLAFLLAVFVAGCGGGAADDANGAASDNPSAATGSGNAKSDQLPQGKPLPASFPADAVPIYAPFSIERAADAQTIGSQTMWSVSGYTHDDPKAVYAKMKADFTAAGYEISEDKYTDDDGNVSGGFSATNDPIAVSLSFDGVTDDKYLGIAYVVAKSETS